MNLPHPYIRSTTVPLDILFQKWNKQWGYFQSMSKYLLMDMFNHAITWCLEDIIKQYYLNFSLLPCVQFCTYMHICNLRFLTWLIVEYWRSAKTEFSQTVVSQSLYMCIKCYSNMSSCLAQNNGTYRTVQTCLKASILLLLLSRLVFQCLFCYWVCL